MEGVSHGCLTFRTAKLFDAPAAAKEHILEVMESTANRRKAAEIIERPLSVSAHERELYEAKGSAPPNDRPGAVTER